MKKINEYTEKKEYVPAEISVIELGAQDVIVTSSGGGGIPLEDDEFENP